MPLSCCPAALALLALAALPGALLLLPSAQRHDQPSCPGPQPWPGSRPYTQPQTQTPIPGKYLNSPLYLNAQSAPDIKKFAYAFLPPRKTPAEKDPLHVPSLKIFHMKKSSGGHEFVLTWLARGWILNLKGSRLSGRP